jgi:hypothetical protein
MNPIKTAYASLVPVGFASALSAIALCPLVLREPGYVRAILGAAAALALASVVLFVTANAAGRALRIQRDIRRVHWVQMCAQGSVLVWWGIHVRSVYGYAPMIAAQILFAFGVDALIQWFRRDTYRIGFGPVPVIFSTNLFLWFKPDWYHFQFMMVAVGFLAKELIRWQRSGASAHIFNPSSFPLAIASLLLIVTGTTGITWGPEIATTQFNPPHMFLVIFLAALPGQLLFGVATMTWSAVLSAYAFGLIYFWLTGVYFFHDAYIPIAVFLGMHLLFTDPSTSPRSESGRVVFGILYGMGCTLLFPVLEGLGAPSFYDKLLPVPILNLSVRFIDRIAQGGFLSRLQPARLVSWTGIKTTRLATASLWAVTFIGVSAAGGIGDEHPGQYLPFWVETCDAGNGEACEYRAFMEQVFCAQGSSWACNEAGVTLARQLGNPRAARGAFERACEADVRIACQNLVDSSNPTVRLARSSPPLAELPLVIRGSKGPVVERRPEALRSLGCSRGWDVLCAT